MTNKQKAILYTFLVFLGFAAVITLMTIFPSVLEIVPFILIFGVAALCAYGFFIVPVYDFIKDNLDRKEYQRNLQIEMEAAQAEVEQLIRDNSPYPLDDVKATVRKVDPGDLY